MINTLHNRMILFQENEVRRVWHENEWYFSVLDVIKFLTRCIDQNDYWLKLRNNEYHNSGIDLAKNCKQLNVGSLNQSQSSGNKPYNTDCANTRTLLRIIQSISSKKAEPFKLWLAKTGYERIQEIENPELAQVRMKTLYELKGYSKQWVDKRLRGIAVRQELTDEWKRRGIEGKEYGLLTNEIAKATFGMTSKQHKELKRINDENLRDHMTDLELIFAMLGEASAAEITKNKNTHGFEQNRKAAQKGGEIAGSARQKLESETDKKVVSKDNYVHDPEMIK